MKKIKILGNEYSRTQLKNNIVRVYNRALPADSIDWYGNAYHITVELSLRYNIPIIKTVGIIASLSPMLSWHKNLEYAELFLSGTAWQDMPCLKQSARKADAIMQSDGTKKSIESILNGQKTTAFFNNILNPLNTAHITIDRHAFSIAVNKRLGNNETSLTATQYRFLVDTYRYTAEKLGISPLLLQSTTWETWRREGRKGGDK